MTYTDTAIVLDREPWRETDKRVIVFTRNHGKAEAVAIGARKITSKLSGHLEPFRCIDMMIAKGKQTDKVAQAVTRVSFTDGTGEYVRMRMLGMLSRLVQRGTESGHKDPALFDALFASMHAVGKGEPAAAVIAFGAALLVIAEHLGYAPELERCVVCGRADELVRFSPAHGGVVCKTCPAEAPVYAYDPAPQKRYLFMVMFFKWRSLL